jgi:hypothetical protein
VKRPSPRLAAVGVRVAHVQGHAFARLQDAVDLAEDLLHRLVILAAGGVELANVAGVGAVVQVGGVRRVDEHEVDLPRQLRRELPRVDAEDVLARRVDVVAQRPPAEVTRHVQSRPAAGERVDYQIVRLRIPLEQIPDDVARRRALVVRVTLHALAVVLRGVVPQRRDLRPQRRLLELHTA